MKHLSIDSYRKTRYFIIELNGVYMENPSLNWRSIFLLAWVMVCSLHGKKPVPGIVKVG